MLLLALQLAAAHVVVDVKSVPKPAPAPIAAAHVAVAPEAQDAAKKVYATRCALCHGAKGQGDGPSAGGLPVKPRRHSDALWQASVTDDDIAAVIAKGGSARKLSILMPASPDLKPDVVKALVDIIRSLRAPNGTARATLVGADKRAIVASADAAGDGSAHVDVAVAPGTYAVSVEVAPGVVACTTSVTVANVDVHVACERKSP